MLVKTTDGTPDAVKVARPVWSGGKSGDNFKGLPITISREGLLYCALIGYIYYEAPEEEQNFTTLLEFINASETREDDEEFKNAVDMLFEELEAEEPGTLCSQTV